MQPAQQTAQASSRPMHATTHARTCPVGTVNVLLQVFDELRLLGDSAAFSLDNWAYDGQTPLLGGVVT